LNLSDITFHQLRISTIALIFFLNSFIATAQLSNRDKTGKDIIFSGNFHYGKAIRHNSKFLPDIPGQSVMAEFNAGANVSGKKHWHHRFNFPEIGGAIIYTDFGNLAVLGRAIGLFPYISFPVVNKPKYKFQIRLGSGVAYLTKPFHIIDNPANNVIGSHVNNVTQLKFLNNIQLSKKWRLLAGFAFTHYSNGNSQKPNLGINVISGNLGLQYVPNNNPDKFLPDSTIGYTKRFMGMVKTGIGINESGVPGAGKFPVYSVMAAAVKPVSRFNRVQVGFEYEFRGDAYVTLQSRIERQDEISRLKVSRFAVLIGDELVFGNFALNLQVGFYTHKFENKPFIFYNKSGVLYYIPINKEKQWLFVSVYLKSHLFVADYFEYGIGCLF
jgi:hypothetical protein